MKKIAKYKALGLLLLTLFFATSCNEFINKLPENNVPGASIDYTKTEEAYKAVLGVMSVSAEWQGSWSVNGLNQVRGDEVEKGNPSPNDQSQYTEFSNLDYTNAANFWAVGGAWGAGFYPIMDANLALIALDKYAEAATTQAQKDLIGQYKLEVRFWRAWAYYFVSRMFGGVPVFTDNNSPDALVKKPYKEVIQFIMSECDAASALPRVHPKDMPNRPGAPSGYSALALKAKAAAEILDYDAMLSATEIIINDGVFDLMGDYYKVFRKAGNLSIENLFELQFYNSGAWETSFHPDNYFAWQGPAHSIESAVKFGETGTNNLGGGWGFMVPTDKFMTFMRSRGEGVRLETTAWEVGTTTRDGDYLKPDATKPYPARYNGKAYTPSTEVNPNDPGYGSGINIIEIRFADILLLNAEAKLAKGGDATTPFNRVRTRAGMATKGSITLDDVMDERLAELAFECNRFYDLARTGKAAEKLPNWTPAKRFYPIPQSQVDLNPALAEQVD